MIFVASGLFAQQAWKGINNSGRQPAEITLLNTTGQSTRILFSLDGYISDQVITPNGIEQIISVGNGVQIIERGAPDLAKLTTTIIIPDTEKMKVVVNRASYVDFEGIDVAPSKGHFTRNIRPEDVPFVYGEMYNKDEFWPSSLAQLEDPFILRDFRGQTVTIFPYQYNAVTKTLRVYYEIEVEVRSTGQAGDNIFNRTHQVKSIDTEFEQIYNRMFLNAESHTKNKYVIGEEGSLLIIAFDGFVDAMKPFVNWKRTIGRKVELVPASTVGATPTAIKNYVFNYYNTNPNFSHLLLVGDAPQIPTNSLSNGHSDNAYGYLVGNDSYNEIIVGRFSAETVAHVQTQVQRIIEYERDLNTSDTWMNKGVGIARNEGTGGGHNGGENDYVHMNFIRDSLLNFTYDVVFQEYDGNVPGMTNTTAALISTRINNGVSIINFCNHGSDTGWSVANYNASHVNQLTNVGKLPFIWSVACVNGNFVSITCFAETWMRATHNGQPTGAISTMMSTVNQPWQPPMTGQDEMVTILVEKRGHLKRTFGGLSINGSMKMIGSHGSSGILTHDTWTLFGDPTLMVRTNVPAEMTVSHNPTLFFGSTTFAVNCDTDGALVAITYTDSNNAVQILGTGVVSGGVANIVFSEPIANPLDLKVAITAFNKVTYLGNVSAVPANEPYIVLNSVSTTAAPDFGQTIGLNVVLKNISQDPYTATNVTAQISTASPHVTILTSEAVSAGTIAPNQIVELTNAFQLSIANNVPNQTPMVFTISFAGQYNGQNYQWQQNFSIRANSPVLEIGPLTINDAVGGNGNGVLDPGETANLLVTILNKGAAPITNLTPEVTLLGLGGQHLTINSISLSQPNIPAGGTIVATINASANQTTPLGTPVDLLVKVTGGQSNQFTASGERKVIIGFIPVYCTSNATNSADTRCDGISFGPLQNTTNVGCHTYRNFTANPALIKEFVIGASYNLAVSLGSCGGSFVKAAKVFVDWNYDGDFTDDGETILVSASQTGNWVASGNVTIPTTAPTGQKFLRIVVRETSDPAAILPCGTYSYGETQDYKIILVSPQQPVANFDALPTQTVETDIVSFTDQSTNHPASWSWHITPGVAGTNFQFVDGTTSTSKNPKVRFITPNVYTISLTVTNIAGSSTMVKQNFITITQLTVVPNADFIGSPTTVFAGQAVQFTDMSNNLPNAWNWTITPGAAGTDYSFENGTTNQSRNPRVKFNTGGFYTVQLVSTNPAGNSAPKIKVNYIEVVPTILMSDGAATICSAMFFDSGGPDGNYQNNENFVFTFHPAMENSKIRVQFLTFNVEHQNTCNFDWLKVYDGPSTSSTLLGTFCGNTTIPGPFISTSGPLTFHFKSDKFISRPGWSASVSCHGPFHNVTFNVTGSGVAIPGALVRIGGKEVLTNENGVATLQDIQAGEMTYTVTKDGFEPSSGTVVVQPNVQVSVSLRQLFKIDFQIKSNQTPIEGATISVNNKSLTTSSQGIASTNLTNGVYDYQVTRTGFQPFSGQVVVEGQNKVIEVNLARLFKVTFQVATSGGPLYRAEIKIGGHTIHSNKSGIADVSLVSGSYPYQVKYMDFPPITGTITIVNDNVFLGVLLETSVPEVLLQEVKIFPNPFRERIYLTGTANLKELVVTNLNGQEIARVQNLGATSLEIQTGKIPAGVYFIKLVGINNEILMRKVVKQ